MRLTSVDLPTFAGATRPPVPPEAFGREIVGSVTSPILPDGNSTPPDAAARPATHLPHVRSIQHLMSTRPIYHFIDGLTSRIDLTASAARAKGLIARVLSSWSRRASTAPTAVTSMPGGRASLARREARARVKR